MQSRGYDESPPVLLYDIHQVSEEHGQLFDPRGVGESGILERTIGCNEVGYNLRDTTGFHHEQVPQGYCNPSRRKVGVPAHRSQRMLTVRCASIPGSQVL